MLEGIHCISQNFLKGIWPSGKKEYSSILWLRERNQLPSLLKQRSPTVLAPGTSSVEDNFYTDRGMQAMMISYKYRWSFASLLATYLPLCSPVRKRPWQLTVGGPGVGNSFPDICCALVFPKFIIVLKDCQTEEPGARQECLFSPVLFSIVLDVL